MGIHTVNILENKLISHRINMNYPGIFFCIACFLFTNPAEAYGADVREVCQPIEAEAGYLCGLEDTFHNMSGIEVCLNLDIREECFQFRMAPCEAELTESFLKERLV